MRFAFFLSISVVAVLLLSTLVNVAPPSASPPPTPSLEKTVDPAREDTSPRNIIVLDRSTELGKASKLLVSGVEQLVEPRDFEGRVELIEIRDTAIGYEPISNFSVTPAPEAPSPVSLETCPQETGAYARPAEVRERQKCEEGNRQKQQSYAEQIRIYETKVDEAAKQRKDIVDSINQFIGLNRPTNSNTEIRRALTEILRSRCDGEPCSLYIFSDLLDTDVKNAVVKQVIGNEKASGLGRHQALEEFPLDGISPNFNVVAWGVGRSDVSVDTELQPAERNRLIEYWHGFFSAWGAHDLYFGFEFRRARPI